MYKHIHIGRERGKEKERNRERERMCGCIFSSCSAHETGCPSQSSAYDGVLKEAGSNVSEGQTLSESKSK